MTYLVLDNGKERPATQAEINEIVARSIPNIPALKAAKNTEINEGHAAANQTSFPYLGKLIACDQSGRSHIDGVAGHISLFGVFPADFPGKWKTEDNSYVPLQDVDAFKQMFAAMTAQGTANFNKSQQLKAALAIATTAAAIKAITWD